MSRQPHILIILVLVLENSRLAFELGLVRGIKGKTNGKILEECRTNSAGSCSLKRGPKMGCDDSSAGTIRLTWR